MNNQIKIILSKSGQVKSFVFVKILKELLQRIANIIPANNANANTIESA